MGSDSLQENNKYKQTLFREPDPMYSTARQVDSDGPTAPPTRETCRSFTFFQFQATELCFVSIQMAVLLGSRYNSLILW